MSVKMCPREPDEAMMLAGMAVQDANDGQDTAGVWRAMYDAAPPQADADTRCARCNTVMRHKVRHFMSCECGWRQESIDQPQADAEALLRELHDAMDRLLPDVKNKWGDPHTLIEADSINDRVRAYLAAKDALCNHSWNYIAGDGPRRRRCVRCNITEDAP